MRVWVCGGCEVRVCGVGVHLVVPHFSPTEQLLQCGG